MCGGTQRLSLIQDPVLSTYFDNFLAKLKELDGETEDAREKAAHELNTLSVDIVMRVVAHDHKSITEENVAILLHAISLFTVAVGKLQTIPPLQTKDIQTNLSDRALKLAQQYLSHFS